MAQQTTLAAAVPYFLRFVGTWPTLTDLAAAPDAEVMAAWAGLGYYSRARNLLACARTVVRDCGGRFPDTEAGLLALPGIGPYTAAAIAAIAFVRPAAAVDGNVERILARLTDAAVPLPRWKPLARSLALALVPAGRPGDFVQAAMDLGARICRPRSPDCLICPWRDACLARARNTQALRPLRPEKSPRPERSGWAFCVVRAGDPRAWLERRPDKGLLGGMTGFPGTPWVAAPLSPRPVLPAAAEGWPCRIASARVHAVFTHFALTLGVAVLEVPDGIGDGEVAAAFGPGFWADPATAGLPGVMAKVRKAAAA